MNEVIKYLEEISIEYTLDNNYIIIKQGEFEYVSLSVWETCYMIDFRTYEKVGCFNLFSITEIIPNIENIFPVFKTLNRNKKICNLLQNN